jgi:hypothetical protein
MRKTQNPDNSLAISVSSVIIRRAFRVSPMNFWRLNFQRAHSFFVNNPRGSAIKIVNRF